MIVYFSLIRRHFFKNSLCIFKDFYKQKIRNFTISKDIQGYQPFQVGEKKLQSALKT